MSDNRPARYTETDSKGRERTVYRASSLGRCDRELVAIGLGYTASSPPEWMLKKYDEGNRHEDTILTWPKATGYSVSTRNGSGTVTWSVDEQQDEVEVKVGLDVIVRGHTDGWGMVSLIGDVGGAVHQEATIEAKAFARSTWDKWLRDGIKAFPYYEWQARMYRAAYRAGVLFVVGLKSDDGEEITEVRAEWLPYDPDDRVMITNRVMHLEALVAQGVLPACPTVQFPCGMYWMDGAACNRETREAEVAEKAGQHVIERWEIREAIKQLEVVSAERLKYEKVEKDLKGAIGRYMKEQDYLEATAEMDGRTWTIKRHVEEVPERVVKGYTKDYVTVKALKDAFEGLAP